MQSNQYEDTEDLKYGDNHGHFIIFRIKKEKSKIFHLWSNLIVLILHFCQSHMPHIHPGIYIPISTYTTHFKSPLLKYIFSRDNIFCLPNVHKKNSLYCSSMSLLLNCTHLTSSHFSISFIWLCISIESYRVNTVLEEDMTCVL